MAGIIIYRARDLSQSKHSLFLTLMTSPYIDVGVAPPFL